MQQHSLSQCYLKSWCDPATPHGQEPYIWLISKNGDTKRRKAPKNVFTRPDRYTITLPDGQRSQDVEKYLSEIEDFYSRVLDKINRGDALTQNDRDSLCLFAATINLRTHSLDNSWRTFQKGIHNLVIAKEKELGLPRKTSLDTEKAIEESSAGILITGIDTTYSILRPKEQCIFVNSDDLGFIASDDPPPGFLPLTPHHMLLFVDDKKGFPLYVDVKQKTVDEANQLMRFHCAEEFISWKGETRSIWFDNPQQ